MQPAPMKISASKKSLIDHGDSTISTATDASTVSAASRGDISVSDSKDHFWSLPYTIALPLLIMMDMLGVSLVVPLLHSQYFQLAGVTSAVQREWLSSIFSVSQIVGGLAIGALSDSAVLSRRSTLILSFMGSAVAYMMIRQGGMAAIVISRVTVGLVKQTMTMTSSIMAHVTEEHERATHVGRLNASFTVAWIVGPSAGAYLFHNVGTFAPIYVSCSLFLLNTAIVLFCLPKETNDHPAEQDKKTFHSGTPELSAVRRIISNFQACFHSSNASLASVVLVLPLSRWVQKMTSYKNIASYYETRYGMEPYQRGYLQSYQSLWALVVQSLLVRPILNSLGGEVNAACFAALAMAVATLAELRVNFQQYLLLICPLMATAVAILGVSLKTVVSKVAPKQSLGSVYATIDVLSNAAQVTVPFYRTVLFSMTQPDDHATGQLAQGDPDPYQWLIVSSLHWLVAAAAFTYLLLGQGNPCASAGSGRPYKHSASNRQESTTDKVKTS